MSEVRENATSTSRIAVAVAVGVLVAAAVIFGIWKASQPSDFECAAQRTDYLLGNIESYEMDSACR